MNFAELLLAAALLSGEAPPDYKTPEFLEANFPTLRLALAHVALEWQILDPRETRPYLCQFLDALQPRLRTQLGPKYKTGVRP